MTYRQIYKYRSIWMGIAILWIMTFHAEFQLKSEMIKNITRFGYAGVDIFLFASGLGCTFSYQRIRKPYKFILRRLLRIYPSYFLFMLIWLPWHIFIYHMPIGAVIGNIFGFEYFAVSAYSFNWYFPFIIILYVLTPFLTELFEQWNKSWFSCLTVLLLLFLFSTIFFNHYDYIIMASRLPIYLLGVIMALHFKESDKVSRNAVIIMSSAFILGLILICYLNTHFEISFLWNYGLFWYPFFLITPGLCFFISWISEKAARTENIFILFFQKSLSAIGGLSLEIYFLHMYFVELCRHYFSKQKDPVILITLITSLAAAYILHKTAAVITGKIADRAV